MAPIPTTPPSEASTSCTNWKLWVGHLKDGCWGEPSNPCPLQGTTGRALCQIWRVCHATVVAVEVAIKVEEALPLLMGVRSWPGGDSGSLGLIHLYLVNRHNVSQERDWGGTESTFLRQKEVMDVSLSGPALWRGPSGRCFTDQAWWSSRLLVRDQKRKKWGADGTSPELQSISAHKVLGICPSTKNSPAREIELES